MSNPAGINTPSFNNVAMPCGGAVEDKRDSNLINTADYRGRKLGVFDNASADSSLFNSPLFDSPLFRRKHAAIGNESDSGFDAKNMESTVKTAGKLDISRLEMFDVKRKIRVVADESRFQGLLADTSLSKSQENYLFGSDALPQETQLTIEEEALIGMPGNPPTIPNVIPPAPPIELQVSDPIANDVGVFAPPAELIDIAETQKSTSWKERFETLLANAPLPPWKPSTQKGQELKKAAKLFGYDLVTPTPESNQAEPAAEQHPKKSNRDKLQSFFAGLKILAMKIFLKYEPSMKM